MSDEGQGRIVVETPASAFVPVLILGLTIVASAAFQTVMLVKDRDALDAARTNQERQIQEATRLRQALDAIARDTARLADAGNANARLIVDELRKRGVTINVNAPAEK